MKKSKKIKDLSDLELETEMKNTKYLFYISLIMTCIFPFFGVIRSLLGFTVPPETLSITAFFLIGSIIWVWQYSLYSIEKRIREVMIKE